MLVLQLVGQLRQARAERLQLLEASLTGVDPNPCERLARLTHQGAERTGRRRPHQAVEADPEELLLPALDGHAQAGGVLEGRVLGGIADAAAAGTEALGRAVHGDLAIEKPLRGLCRDRTNEEGEIERESPFADTAQPAGDDSARQLGHRQASGRQVFGNDRVGLYLDVGRRDLVQHRARQEWRIGRDHGHR